MEREIYEVYAKVVDANGTYNTLSGYPKVFDSKNYDGDVEKARDRAFGEFHAVLGTMYPRDDRKLQLAMVFRANDGVVFKYEKMGVMSKMTGDGSFDDGTGTPAAQEG